MKEREYFALKLGKKDPQAGFPGRDKIVGGKMDDITVVVATVQDDSAVGGAGGGVGAGGGKAKGAAGKSKL